MFRCDRAKPRSAVSRQQARTTAYSSRSRHPFSPSQPRTGSCLSSVIVGTGMDACSDHLATHSGGASTGVEAASSSQTAHHGQAWHHHRTALPSPPRFSSAVFGWALALDAHPGPALISPQVPRSLAAVVVCEAPTPESGRLTGMQPGRLVQALRLHQLLEGRRCWTRQRARRGPRGGQARAAAPVLGRALATRHCATRVGWVPDSVVSHMQAIPRRHHAPQQAPRRLGRWGCGGLVFAQRARREAWFRKVSVNPCRCSLALRP